MLGARCIIVDYIFTLYIIFVSRGTDCQQVAACCVGDNGLGSNSRFMRAKRISLTKLYNISNDNVLPLTTISL